MGGELLLIFMAQDYDEEGELHPYLLPAIHQLTRRLSGSGAVHHLISKTRLDQAIMITSRLCVLLGEVL